MEDIALLGTSRKLETLAIYLHSPVSLISFTAAVSAAFLSFLGFWPSAKAADPVSKLVPNSSATAALNSAHIVLSLTSIQTADILLAVWLGHSIVIGPAADKNELRT